MKMKAMGHQTKKTKANPITDHIGKLLRKNEELQKKKGESNGCKMKKTGDKNFYKMPRSVEQLKKLEENKTEETLNLELNKKNKIGPISRHLSVCVCMCVCVWSNWYV